MHNSKICFRLCRIISLIFAAALLCGAFFTCPEAAAAGSTPDAGNTEVYFFDAGDADAVLITENDFTVLIDSGSKNFGDTVLKRLEECGTDHLDCMIITHFDKDHVGGAAKIINTIPVYRVLQSVETKHSTEYEKYLKALSNAKIQPETVTDTVIIESGSLCFEVIPPAWADYKDKESNNSSLIVSMTCGKHSALFTGDAADERLYDFLSGCEKHYDLVKMPHHGIWQDSCTDLIKNTAPKYAVICCKDSGDAGKKTLKLLCKLGIETLFTGGGPVSVLLSEDGLTVSQ